MPSANRRQFLRYLAASPLVPASFRSLDQIFQDPDLITSPEMIREAQSLIPNAQCHEVKGAGHSAYFEKADEWNRVVRRFIETVPGHLPRKGYSPQAPGSLSP